MTLPAATIPSESPADSPADSGASLPAGWADVRNDSDLQFAPVSITEVPPRQPGWFEELLISAFTFLGELFAPLGQLIGASWFWLQWVLLIAAVAFALVMLVRMFGPGATKRHSAASETEAEWQPDRVASLALLEDADRLAAEGRFDEATRLLLQRSVGHIAAVRPDWVEPSSTARELASLPALPDAARAAFRVISERVERSLFALRALDRPDWEAARAAYAEFALARLNHRERST
jgi:hypothetical protein